MLLRSSFLIYLLYFCPFGFPKDFPVVLEIRRPKRQTAIHCSAFAQTKLRVSYFYAVEREKEKTRQDRITVGARNPSTRKENKRSTCQCLAAAGVKVKISLRRIVEGEETLLGCSPSLSRSSVSHFVSYLFESYFCGLLLFTFLI